MSRGTMAVIVPLVIRPILRERMRTLLTITGIAVGVAVVVAIQLASQSALRAFSESIDAISGRANFQIVSEGATLDERILVALQPLWKSGGRFAPVIDVEGSMLPGETPIRLLGVDLLSDLHFRDYRYARVAVRGSKGGVEPVSSEAITSYLELFRRDSVIVPASFARDQRLEIGSPLTLSFLGKTSTFIVRGILETKGPATAFNGSIAIMDIGTAQGATGLEGRLSRIDLLIPEQQSEALIAGLRRIVPRSSRIERPSRRNARVDKMLRAFRVNLFALAGVALLVGMFLVYNTVLISILRRRRDVGIFKTLGVSSRQIFAAFMTEGLLFGLVGSLLGLVLGKLLAAGILDLIGRTINTLYVTTSPEQVTVTPAIAAIGITVGTLLSAVSSIQPSIEAASVRPDLLIRAGLQQRLSAGGMSHLAIAAVMALAAGWLVSLLPPINGIAVAGYVAVLLIVVGFSLLSPLFVTTASRMARRPFAALFGVIGSLAGGSLPSSLRRTAVASAALSLATGMMVAVALMVGSFRETVNVWVRQTVSSDIWLRPARGLTNAAGGVFPETIVDDLRGIPWIRAIDRVRAREMVYHDSNIGVGGGDFPVVMQYGDLPMIGPSSKVAMSRALTNGGVVISESFGLKFDKSIGESIELPTVHGMRNFPIDGIYRDYSSDRGTVMMNRALYVESFGDSTINTVALYLAPGISPDWARGQLERRLGAKYHAFAITNASIRREVMTIFDQTFLITYALLGVAVIVAVLGIVNTLSALILERRHEIALLRVLGTTRGEVRTMLLLESGLLGLISTVVGLVNGYVLSWILIFVINKQSFGWTIAFHTPVLLIATSLAVTFAAAILAGLAPARVANRLDFATALKRE